MLKLIFCDIDGTLTGHATDLVDDVIRRHVQTLQQHGIKFGLATSHWIHGPWTDQFCDYYNLDFMVLENGSVLYLRSDTGSYERLQAYDDANREKLAHFEAFKQYVNAAGKPTGENCVVIDGVEMTIAWRCASLLARTVDKDDNLLPVMSRLEDTIQANGWRVQFVEPRTFAMEAGIATKGDGARYLAGHLGIDMAQTCAIGDSDNDLEMLAGVGLPACPANATPSVIDIVSRRDGIIADENAYLGTRQILEQLARDATA